MWSLGFLSFTLLFTLAVAQSATPTPTPTPESLSFSVFPSTVISTIVTTTHRNGDEDNVQTTTLTSSIPINVTSTFTLASSTPTATPEPTPISLATKVDPAFGVLGCILILSGLPNAFYGHKNRWTSFFIIGFYTMSLVCFILITKFGILAAVNPPSNTIRGMFVLASFVAGVVGGATAIFFWKGAKYFIGAWGGFAFALFVQCFRNGGVIREVGYRWIFFIGCAVIGFILCTIPKIHYHILLISTAIVGASATILGIDCFTTAGLKEFYMWNMGFHALFPKFTENGIQFPVSQTMQIELGMMGAIALMGSAVQLRILAVLQRKLEEIAEDHKKQNEDAEADAADRFNSLGRDKEAWEKDHPTLPGRNESGLSSVPLMRDHDGTSPQSVQGSSSPLTMVGEGRGRTQSGMSEFLAGPSSNDDVRRAARKNQPQGLLPTVDVGVDLGDDVPDTFISQDVKQNDGSLGTERDHLFNEISHIRRSIDALHSESGSGSGGRSRHVSLSSRLSLDAGNALGASPSHSRNQTQENPMGRVQSMELSAFGRNSAGDAIPRPASAPLRDEEWDAYVKDRKLMQPPSGPSVPISLSPSPSHPPMPAAVGDAINQRRSKESQYLLDDSEDTPLSQMRPAHIRSSSGGPVTVLPPIRRGSTHLATPASGQRESRVKSFEELEERHRGKMKEMQAPISEAAKEQVAIAEAKARWERSKAAEKKDFTRRQAVQQEKRTRRDGGGDERAGRQAGRDSRGDRRSLSADKLTALGGSGNHSKRLSTMKVQDWQRYQSEEVGGKGQAS